MGKTLLTRSTNKASNNQVDPIYSNHMGNDALGVVGDVMLVDSLGNEVTGFKSPSGASYCYIGKPANGDFVVGYLGANTITISSYPTGVTAMYDEDIELIRQINNTGTVVATYGRGDTTMTVSGTTITVSGATFAATDTFIVYTNIPKPSSSGSGGAGGGSIVYTNMSGDFIATPTNGAATITITGLPFTLEAKHVAAGQIKKIAVTTGVTSTLSPSSISVTGGVITLGGIANFVTGDELAVTLIGPDKAYDTSLDNQLVAVQNPDYAHTTGVETLIYEDDFTGYNYTADAGGDANHLDDASVTFSNAVVAIGYTAYDITEGKQGTVSSVSTNIVNFSGSTATDWSSDEYYLPGVKRYEINVDTYNYMTLHWRLTTVANVTCYLKIYGTLDATATVDDDTNWVDLSSAILGSATGITSTGAVTTEGLKIIDTPSTMLKYMLKLVVEKSTTGVSNGALYTVFVKKSS